MTMININELRRLAQAASPGPDGVSLSWITFLQDFQQSANPAAISELLDRLEEAERDIALKEKIIDSLGVTLTAVVNECNTPYSFDPTDNGTICVRCLKEKMKVLLQLIQQPLSKVRTLSPEQIERHKLTAGECPSGSEVLLVSSVRRLLGCGIGDEKNWQMLNQMPDALRKQMQSQAKRVDDDLCRLTGMGAYKASPEAKP